MPDTHTRTQHTPGSWTRNGQGEIARVSYWRIDSLGEERVGLDFLKHPIALVRTSADASLVEAAPDLLAALEALTDHLEDEITLAASQDAIYPGEDQLTALLLAADAAIRKARGA